MRTWRNFLAAAVLSAAVMAVHAQGPLPDVEQVGPQVGDVVPSFTLPDHNGEMRDLASLTGTEGLMLVFSRSADW